MVARIRNWARSLAQGMAIRLPMPADTKAAISIQKITGIPVYWDSSTDT